MLEFNKPEIHHRDQVKKCCSASGYMCSEYAFGNLYMWKDYAKTGICIKDGLLYMLSDYEGGPAYRMPAGSGDIKKGIDNLIEDAKQRGIGFRIACVTDEMRTTLEKYYPGAFSYTERRDYADYIYRSEDLITLAGKKLHAKRNHLNKCLKKYSGNCHFEPISDKNIDDIIAFNKRWYEQNLPGADESLLAEKFSTELCLANCRDIGLVGGGIWVGEKLVAYTYGSELNCDLFVIHVEKADVNYDGAYAAINNYFAKEMLSSYRLINREEDMGIEGLRKAKLSYQPEIILMRYDAVMF